MALYLFIMAIVTWVITGAALIGLIVKFVSACVDYDRPWCKLITCCNFLAVATLGSAIGVLFYVVAGLL